MTSFYSLSRRAYSGTTEILRDLTPEKVSIRCRGGRTAELAGMVSRTDHDAAFLFAVAEGVQRNGSP